MIAYKKQFDLVNGIWTEVSYPANIGYLTTGSDNIERRIIMSTFIPDFPNKVFDFVFQVWSKTKNKNGLFNWSFNENFNLRANKTTWLGSGGTEYSEFLLPPNPLSAWVNSQGNEILDNNGDPTGIYETILTLRSECLINNFDYWHGQIFGTVEPVLGQSIINKNYYEITTITT
jgi:hypothetical protein